MLNDGDFLISNDKLFYSFRSAHVNNYYNRKRFCERLIIIQSTVLFTKKIKGGWPTAEEV